MDSVLLPVEDVVRPLASQGAGNRVSPGEDDGDVRVGIAKRLSQLIPAIHIVPGFARAETGSGRPRPLPAPQTKIFVFLIAVPSF